MWRPEQIAIEVTEAEGSAMVVSVTTPIGRIEIIGDVSRVGRALVIKRAHVQGAAPGLFRRAGLNAVARKLVVEADVDEIVFEGGTRTTGRTKGRRPRPIRFPR